MDKSRDFRGSDERTSSLRTYLHDHAAGARYAVELLKALKDRHAGSVLDTFVEDQLVQIEADLETLEGLARRFGTEGLHLKEFAGWFADKVSRLKLSPPDHPFHTFEILEFLSLGILGKRALWKTLRILGPLDPLLHDVDLDTLLQRAEAQYAATEAARLELAAKLFG